MRHDGKSIDGRGGTPAHCRIVCGRYALDADSEELINTFVVVRDSATPETERRYNIAPTQNVAVVLHEQGARRLRMVRWGLVPPQWSASDARRAPLINTRAETVASHPLFRNSFARRRCLVPACGFFEWRRTGARRQPWFVRRPDAAPLACAGIHARWQRGDHPPVVSCAIVTVPANAQFASLHDRMPAILPASDWVHWLDPQAPAETVRPLLRPATGELIVHPVTTRMNHYAYDQADALAPIAAVAGEQQLTLLP